MHLTRWALLAWGLAFPAVAHAQDKAACLQAHEHGQELRIGGKWRAARSEFATCSAASCPVALSKDCVTWNAELSEKMPTLLVVARTPTGEETLEASLDVDGERRSDALAGTALEVDPGEHVLLLRHTGWTDVSKRLVVNEGERDRRVEVAFTALASGQPTIVTVVAPTETLSRRKHGLPTASIVLGAMGVVALGVGAGFDISGGVDYNLGCYGHCTTDQASSINTRFVVGDVALGVGVVALGVALIVALTHR